jgi:opacity protein-like surface antigen
MKKSFAAAAVLVFVATASMTHSAQGPPESKGFNPRPQYLALLAGFNSHRPTVEPFGALPFPFGLSYEHRIRESWGIGTTLMFDRWCDYLGMFGGKYAFQVFKPSLDVVYHLGPGRRGSFDLFAGGHLGYSFFWVTNELGNDYAGNLRHEPHIAPFVGTVLHIGKTGAGFMGRLSLTARLAWSVTGRLSGLYGTAGIVLRMK